MTFSLLAFAAASPSHAGKSWNNWGGTAPTISGTPPTSITVGQVYAFRPTAADADGDRLSFRVGSLPGWASYDRATGTITGTPTSVGRYTNVEVRVTDGRYWTKLPTFTITVTQPAATVPVVNQAPTISGTPVTTARVSQPYAFRPTAVDADGDRLTFGVQGKPAWATFDSADGTLYGTPSPSDAREFSGVVISASDGKSTVNLPAFSISVSAAPTSSVRMSWHPPSSNVDGTPITDLSGYRVFFGNVSGQYDYSLGVPNPDVTSVVIEGLATATTWYFVAKAVSSSGVESAYSAPVSKTLP